MGRESYYRYHDLGAKRWGVETMTTIQQVLFELESSYAGHPYFVTGNAIVNALAQQDAAGLGRSLCASHGMFVPGEYGEHPPGASQDGYAGKLGQSLPEVASYEGLFIFRDAAQRWLLASRPRDAHNVLDVQTHGGRLVVAPECWFGRPPGQRNRRRSMSWYVQCYLHDSGAGTVPVSDALLEGLRVGGARNYGFGELSLVDTQVIELEALDYSGVRSADELQLELLSPYVLASGDPKAEGQSVPWWWSPNGQLRRRTTRLVAGDDCYELATIDHGQAVAYEGDRPVATAKNGVQRVGTHSKYGFGEFRLRPADADRVPERTTATEGRMAGGSP